ncbi:hypothetical protein HFU84_12095 [Acidithiobacillus sp. CV18-2]|nr:hypothetical protein [Acidithiobacillus sp. CV18-3]MBU2758347.1 hypothetical protein [Acidithiobacillus sp. BN09-2]MBU2778228.1 hypothetical protein [Acidithiobacillus sp. CV18-2]MBU2799101.1 hypothetical protein [Acidithiobacillus sp. VAN18-4]
MDGLERLVAKGESGKRKYSSVARRRYEEILKARELNYTWEDIAEGLELRSPRRLGEAWRKEYAKRLQNPQKNAQAKKTTGSLAMRKSQSKIADGNGEESDDDFFERCRIGKKDPKKEK